MTSSPMTAAGGAFLVCVGVSLVASAVTATSQSLGAVFRFLPAGVIVGAACLFAVATITRRRTGLAPTQRQKAVAWGTALVGALVLFGLSKAGLFSALPQQLVVPAALAIVSLHFIPMTWSHGPWMLRLAIVGLAWLLIAVLAHLAVTWIVAVYGAIDIVIGSIMANVLVAQTRAAAGTT